MFLDNCDAVSTLIEETFDHETHPVYEGGWVDTGEIFTNDDINMLAETYPELEYTSDIENYM